MTFGLPALSLGLFTAAVTTASFAQSNPTYIPFPTRAVKGALYRPDSGPSPRVGVLMIHRTANFLSHRAATELSARGYLVLAMNPRSDNNEAAVRVEENIFDTRSGVEFLRRQPGIRKVLLFGHSGGGPATSLYQAVAENGPGYCQGPDKIVQCGNDAAGFPRADGIILADAHPGSAVGLRAINPSEGDSSLDPFERRNGYNPNGPSHYSEEFKRRYFKAQSETMNRAVEAARKRLLELKGRDEVFLAPPGGGRLLQLDPSIHHSTLKPCKLIRNDGAVVTRRAESVRPAGLPAGEETAPLSRILTLKSFLSAHAVRSRDSMDDIDWCSTNNSTPCALQKITVPMLVAAMGGHYFVRDSEMHYELAASKDKDFIVIDGATHNFLPCTACETRPGQYSNTVRNLFDYIKKWIDARFLSARTQDQSGVPEASPPSDAVK